VSRQLDTGSYAVKNAVSMTEFYILSSGTKTVIVKILEEVSS
jgi:hypothetical protein